MEQLTIFEGATPAQQEALSMHYEIVAAAQTAASSLLDLGRKLKRMRDTGRYKDLGFDNFGTYTEAAVGIRQRQAYTYITVVEKLPAQLIEENAAAGVTKLALLAKLGPEDREEIAGDGLANITVADLQKLIEEKNGLAEQLSMLQDTAPAAEVEAVDAEQAIREAVERAREETEREVREQLRAEKDRAVTEAVAQAREEARREAAVQAKEEADRRVKKAEEEVAGKLEAARKQAAEEVRREQEAQYKAVLAEKEQAARDAQARAEGLAKQMQLAGSPEGTRFALLFDDLQQKAGGLMDMLDKMLAEGKAEAAQKYKTALAGALRALIQQVEEVG